MSRFLLDTDTLDSVSKNIYTSSQELLELSETVSSYSVDTDDFDFAGARNKISDNLNKMNIRVTNISQVIGYAVDSHTAIQKSLKCNASDSLNVKGNTSSGNTQTGSTSSNSSTQSYSPNISGATNINGNNTLSNLTPQPEQPVPEGSINVVHPTVTPPEEEKKSFVNYFQQNYQNEYGEGATIAAKGAAPTAIAMVLTALKGEEITPVETAKWSLDNGFVTQESTTETTYFDAIAEAYGIDCVQVDLTEENILANISEGKYMIVSMEEGQFGETENYVVITGITEDGKITIADPNSEDNSTKTWDISVFLDEGTKLWVF